MFFYHVQVILCGTRRHFYLRASSVTQAALRCMAYSQVKIERVCA